MKDYKERTVQGIANHLDKHIGKLETSGMPPDPDWLNTMRFFANLDIDLQHLMIQRDPRTLCASNVQTWKFGDIVAFASKLEEDPVYLDRCATRKALKKQTMQSRINEINDNSNNNQDKSTQRNNRSGKLSAFAYCLGIKPTDYFALVDLTWKEMPQDKKNGRKLIAENVRKGADAIVPAFDGAIKFCKPDPNKQSEEPKIQVCIDRTNGQFNACNHKGHAQYNCPHNQGAKPKDPTKTPSTNQVRSDKIEDDGSKVDSLNVQSQQEVLEQHSRQLSNIQALLSKHLESDSDQE